MTKREANQMSANFLEGVDLGPREKGILADIKGKIDYRLIKPISQSTWWGSLRVGASHYRVYLPEDDKEAVLKIQGVRPNVSEAEMIRHFMKTNQSRLLRPPHLYCDLPWNEEQQYEALFLEFVQGEKLVDIPATAEQVADFFTVYEDYRQNCRQSPWIDKPEKPIPDYIGDNFTKRREASRKIYPDHPLRQPEDEKLIKQAVEKLQSSYVDAQWEFVHPHLSEKDLCRIDSGQVVLFSNLYWSWQAPFYDAVFGYHWFMYELANIADITPDKIDEQRQLWLSKIETLPKNELERKWLRLALLERAAAGLNLDGLMCDPEKPISQYLLDQTREQIRSLMAREAY